MNGQRNPSAAISARGIHKSFGPTRALVDAELTIAAGEVVALMGANGAGKSTLVKILSGALQPDSGTVEVGGQAVELRSPRDARRLGVATVHQATADAGVPGLSLAENLILDDLCGGGPVFTSQRQVRRRAAEVAAAVDLQLPLNRNFGDLGPAERQLVAIARAVSAKASVLILDEPTSTLSSREAERLFAVLRRLRDRGLAILYISHRIGDLAAIADRAVVLRGGQVVARFTSPIDFGAAITAMIGRSMDKAVAADSSRQARPVIAAFRGIRLIPGSRPFDLDIHTGEVVAITGTLGSGKSRLLRAIFGLERLAAGRIFLDGREWHTTGPRQSISRGVFMAGEDRWRSSLMPPATLGGTVAGTISLPHLRRFFARGLIDSVRESAIASNAIERLGIRARSPDDTLDQLSGGNQQKVVLARWQAAPSQLLLLDEPFQGVDVGARADLIAAIRSRQDRSATLIATSDPEEALEVADRILVMQNHTLVEPEEESVEGSLVAALNSVESLAAGSVDE